MKVTVHIGLPKTGTSAIQSFLGANVTWLREQGIEVPLTGFHSAYGHSFLFTQADLSKPARDVMRFLGVTSQLPAGQHGNLPELKQEIAALRDRGVAHALLSWEGLSLVDSAAIGKLCACFEGCDLEILCYVREQSALRTSQLLHSVTEGMIPARGLLDGGDQLQIGEQAYLDYNQLLDTWAGAAGNSGRIRTRMFDREMLAQGDVVEDFVEALEIQAQPYRATSSREVNTSLDAASTALVALGEEIGVGKRQRQRLVSALLEARSKKTGRRSTGLFPTSQLENLSAQYLAANEALLENYPPENCSRERFEELMIRPARDADTTAPTVELCRAAVAAIHDRELITWHGQLLISHKLNIVTRYIDDGWRGSEATGIWSIGDRSRIAFRLPRLNLQDGPLVCQLNIQAAYFGDNIATRVVGMGIDERIDLRNGVIRVPVTSEVLEEGIFLELIHEHPTSPVELGSGPSADKLALQLRVLFYRLTRA
jgi:hypothetical protein